MEFTPIISLFSNFITIIQRSDKKSNIDMRHSSNRWTERIFAMTSDQDLNNICECKL